MSSSRVRLLVMAVAGAVALVTGVWWWGSYRVQVSLMPCIFRDDGLRPAGSPMPPCLAGPVNWAERIVTTTFALVLTAFLVIAVLELRTRWVAARAQRPLRTQA